MHIYITGITGTLGTAFAKYLTDLGHKVTGIDHNEERVSGTNIKLGDFGDETFSTHRPDVLIHLAAFKHVDLCEKNPSAAISNNVIKSYSLLHAAKRNNVNILFMSTDKAVEPCSVYGYTKALIEALALELGGSIARSGNVLASNGSVLNLWRKQIESNQPLTITHPDMHRYFITPENLVERVWDLYSQGEKVIIPEMDIDKPLLDIAEDLLQTYGLSFDTYPVIFTGLRPGEKLREKLYADT